MTKQLSIFISFFVLLCVTSCQSNMDALSTQSNIPVISDSTQNSANPKRIITLPEELAAYVHEYIDDHLELFGSDVVVFDTWEELDQELEVLQQMTYTEHRTWLNQRQLNSPVMNSLIIHDSVQAAIWEYFGIDFDETGLCNSNVNIMENYIEDEGLRLLEDDAFAHYDEIMATYYSDYVKVDTTLNNEILMSPLGILDEQVFCNTHNLYICEGMVVKYLSDGHFSCPIDEYEYYENKISVYDIDVSDPHSRIRVSPSAPNDVTFDSNNSIDYKTEVNFHISVTSSWFGLERKCTSMCATNYHRNANGNYRRVACETKIIADVGVQCNAGTWDYHFRTGWCPMGGGMIYYRIKYTDCGCHNTHFSYIALECRNQHGVVINEHL